MNCIDVYAKKEARIWWPKSSPLSLSLLLNCNRLLGRLEDLL